MWSKDSIRKQGEKYPPHNPFQTALHLGPVQTGSLTVRYGFLRNLNVIFDHFFQGELFVLYKKLTIRHAKTQRAEGESLLSSLAQFFGFCMKQTLTKEAGEHLVRTRLV